MIRQKILQQLLEWIECNLEHPISIEDIAQKSGYIDWPPESPDNQYHLNK